MKTQSKYFDSTAKINTVSVLYALEKIKNFKSLWDRVELLKEMWVMWDREPPFFVRNWAGVWINPYLVYKFFWEKWLPVEFFMDRLEKEMTWIKDFQASDYWYEWCDFWLETFLKWDINKIRENFIINPK